MLPQRSVILILSVLTLSHGIEEVKRSLVIVMDVTESMNDKIPLLRTESIKLLDNLYKWRNGQNIENYILVQFGDDLNKREFKVIVNENYEEMKKELNDVKINRYNKDKSCLASCYSALQYALSVAKNDSILFVFTDAGSNNKELLPEIKNLAQQKRISFFFILTKGCPKTNSTDDYYDLVSIYNGDIFNVDHSDKMTKHFQLLSQILSGPPLFPSVEIFVDSTMSEFTLTVTGRNIIITIFDPTQKYVSSTRYKMLTNIPNIQMIQVPNPMPGRYTVEIVSETAYSGQVQTKSDLQFKYGFSIHEPNSMLETNYAPLRAHNTYLAISPSNTSLIDNLDHVLLQTSDRQYKYELQRKATHDGEIYVTKSFPLYFNKPFKINVNGHDRLNHPIIRLISPVIEAITGDIPDVIVNTNITVTKSKPIHLFCRVSSILNVTVSWSKTELNGQHKFLGTTQSKLLNYTIDKSQITDSGEYICSAINIVGRAESKTFVSVKHSPLRFELFTPIKSINTKVGTEMIELQCDVSLTLVQVKVSWMFNGNDKLPDNSQYISPNLKLFNIQPDFNGTYTCVGQTETEEKQDSVHLNVMYPPEIVNLFNLNTKSYIDASQPIEIDYKAAMIIICNYKGNPIPIVQWVNQTSNIVSYTKELKIDGYNKQSGEFSCQVQNELGIDQRNIRVMIKPGPLELSTEKFIAIPIHNKVDSPVSISIRNDSVKSYQINEPPSLELSILDLTMAPNEKIIEYSAESVIALPENEAPNSEEVMPKHNFKPVLLQNYKYSKDLIEGTSFIMHCPIDSGEYNVTWILNGQNIDHLKLSNGSIYFETVQANMKGDVICIASNSAGSTRASITFDILKQPYDFRLDKSTNESIFLNDPFVVQCSANGNPKPHIYWLKNYHRFSVEDSITFQKVQSSDEGNYTCVAENVVGKIQDTLKLQVFTHSQNFTPANNIIGTTNVGSMLEVKYSPLRFELFTPIKSINTKVGTEMIELQCDVSLTLVHVKVSWMFNGNDKLPDNSQYISPNLKLFNIQPDFNGTYTCIGQTETEEKQDSVHLNVMYPPEIVNLFNLNTKSYIDTSQPIEIDYKAAMIIICNYKGNPIPTVQWVNQTSNIVSYTKKLKIDGYNKQSGEFSCQVQNELGIDQRNIRVMIKPGPLELSTEKFIAIPIHKKIDAPISISSRNNSVKSFQINEPRLLKLSILDQTMAPNKEIIEYSAEIESVIAIPEKETPSSEEVLSKHNFKPMLLQNYKQSEDLIEGTSFIMHCPIDSGEYNVTWKLNGQNIDHLKLSNGSIYFETVTANMKGDVICIASNSAGSTNASITFDILKQPYDFRLDKSTDKSIFLNDPFVVQCSANGNPKPHVYWLKNGHRFSVENSITFEKVQSSDEGNYTCVAENVVGKIQQTLKLQVFAHSQNFTPANNITGTKNLSSMNIPITHNTWLPPYDIQIKTSTDKKIFVNERFELKCSTKGNPTPSVFWTKDDKFFEIENTIYFEKIQLSDAGNYTCIADNPVGSIQKTLKLQVFDHPQIFDPPSIKWPSNKITTTKAAIGPIKSKMPYDIQVEPSTNGSAFINERYELKCSANGDPEPELYWMKNGDFFKTGNSITFHKLQPSNNGEYTCIATNYLGDVNKTFILQIPIPPRFVNLTDFVSSTNRNNADKFGNKMVLQYISVRRSYVEANYEKIIEVNENEQIILNCTMFGDPTPQIRWFKNNNDLNVSNKSVYVYNEALMKNSGIYKCIGSNTIGQAKAIFYVNVKKPVSFASFSSPNKIYSPGDSLSIKCSASGNPLPTIRIYSDNYSTGSDLIFSQPDNIKKMLFHQNKEFYFEGNTIIDAKRAASLNRYGVLTYDRYVGRFGYIIRSIDFKDAGNYTCTAAQLANKINKSITIKVKLNLKNSIESQNPINITQNMKLFKLKCPLLQRPANIKWLRGNKRITKSNPHLIPNGQYLEIRNPQSYHTGPYSCTNGSLKFNFKIVVQPAVSPFRLNQKKRHEIKIEKDSFTVLQCPLKRNIIYWFEILNLQNLTTNEVLLLNKSLNYEIIADSSRTIMCSSDPSYIDGEIFQIIVQEKPRILTVNTDLGIRLHDNFLLECKATGNPQPIIKWYKSTNNLLVKVETLHDYHVLNGVLKKNGAQISDESNFLCTATNEFGYDKKMFKINLLP